MGGDVRWVQWEEEGKKGGREGWAEVRVVDVDVDVDVEDGMEGEGGGEEEGAAALAKRTRRMIVNTPPTSSESVGVQGVEGEKLVPVAGLKIRGAREIVGPFVQLVKGTRGSVARIRVEEGMWEVRRGVKVDGGERRKAMVRRQRTLDERKKRRV